MKRSVLLGLILSMTVLGGFIGCGSNNSPVNPNPPSVQPSSTPTVVVSATFTPTFTCTFTPTSTPSHTPSATPTSTATVSLTPPAFEGKILLNEVAACSGTAKSYVTLYGAGGAIQVNNVDVSTSSTQITGPNSGTYSVAVTVVYGNLVSGVFYASTTLTGSLNVPGNTGGTKPGQVSVDVSCSGNTMVCNQGPF